MQLIQKLFNLREDNRLAEQEDAFEVDERIGAFERKIMKDNFREFPFTTAPMLLLLCGGGTYERNEMRSSLDVG